MRMNSRRQRRLCGRRPEPRLAIIDTQGVKCIGARGFDGAKKLVGRKRVTLVDAEAHTLALTVVQASVQDRGALRDLDHGKEDWPSLRLALFDGGFTAEWCQTWCHLHGMHHRVAEKKPEQKGFVVLERHWLFERTFGWLSHWRGFLHERAGRLDVATGRLACVACLMAIGALCNPLLHQSLKQAFRRFAVSRDCAQNARQV